MDERKVATEEDAINLAVLRVAQCIETFFLNPLFEKLIQALKVETRRRAGEDAATGQVHTETEGVDGSDLFQ
jgi:hypothetical protein